MMRNDKQANSDDFYTNWDDDDLQIVDLETLNNTDEDMPELPGPSWSVPVLRWQSSFTRKRWRTIATASSILLVCLVLFLNLHTTLSLFTTVRNGVAARLVKPQPLLQENVPTPIPISPSLVIPLAQNGFTCVNNESWSPDSTMIALVGYASGCEYNSNNATGLFTIQDARTGQRIVQVEPDALIKKTISTQFPAIHDSLIFSYQAAAWSPDKVHLAILFSVLTGSDMSNELFSGILLFDSVHKTSRIMLQKEEGKPLYQVSSSSYEEWDIVHGNLIPTPTFQNVDPFVFNTNIPVAEEYAWDKNGELLPQTPTNTHRTGIGSPIGSPSFTVWQPGAVELVKQDQSDGITFTPGIFVWQADFIAWSPDGRYLINGAYLAARLEPPGHPRPDQKTLVAFHMENLPVLPIRDAALLSALKQLSSTQTIGTLFHMVISWSPNGRLTSMTTYEFIRKNLYSTKSGFAVAVLQAPQTDGLNGLSSHSGNYAFSFPNWSPDSTRILAQDPSTDAVVVWNIPNSLK